MLYPILLVLIRLWSVTTFLTGLAYVPSISFSLEAANLHDVAFMAVVPMIVYLAAGLAGWFFAGAMAERVTSLAGAPKDDQANGKEPAMPPEQTLSIDDVIAAGSLLIGVFYFLSSAAYFARSLATLWVRWEQYNPGSVSGNIPPDMSTLVAEVVSEGLALAVALLLVFRPAILVGLFHLLRRVGLRKHGAAASGN